MRPAVGNSPSQWEATLIPNGKQFSFPTGSTTPRPAACCKPVALRANKRDIPELRSNIIAEPRERPQHGQCAWRRDGRAPSSTVWRSPRRRRRRRRGPPAADALPPRRRGCAGVQQILNPNSNRLGRVHLAFSRRPIKATRVCPQCGLSRCTEIRFPHMTGCAAARSRAGDRLHRSAGIQVACCRLRASESNRLQRCGWIGQSINLRRACQQPTPMWDTSCDGRRPAAMAAATATLEVQEVGASALALPCLHPR